MAAAALPLPLCHWLRLQLQLQLQLRHRLQLGFGFGLRLRWLPRLSSGALHKLHYLHAARSCLLVWVVVVVTIIISIVLVWALAAGAQISNVLLQQQQQRQRHLTPREHKHKNAFQHSQMYSKRWRRCRLVQLNYSSQNSILIDAAATGTVTTATATITTAAAATTTKTTVDTTTWPRFYDAATCENTWATEITSTRFSNLRTFSCMSRNLTVGCRDGEQG